MNKKWFLLVLLPVLLTVLAGCGVSEFSIRVDDDNTALIEAKNAGKGDSGVVGALTVGENEKLVVESDLSGKGEILLKLFIGKDLDMDASVEDLDEAHDSGSADLELTLSGKNTNEYPLPAGNYELSAEVLSKVSGTVKIRVAPIE